MSENLYCEGHKRITPGYKDGYYRTFKGVPEMSSEVEGMIQEWVDDGEFNKIFYFFREKVELNIPELELNDYIMFIIREKFL